MYCGEEGEEGGEGGGGAGQGEAREGGGAGQEGGQGGGGDGEQSLAGVDHVALFGHKVDVLRKKKRSRAAEGWVIISPRIIQANNFVLEITRQVNYKTHS